MGRRVRYHGRRKTETKDSDVWEYGNIFGLLNYCLFIFEMNGGNVNNEIKIHLLCLTNAALQHLQFSSTYLSRLLELHHPLNTPTKHERFREDAGTG